MNKIAKKIITFSNMEKSTRVNYFNTITYIYKFGYTIVLLVMAIIFYTPFYLISAIYSFGIGVSRIIYSRNFRNNDQKTFLKMSIVLLISNLFYLINMITLFFTKTEPYYHLIPAIAIAAVTFFNLTIAVIQLIKSFGENNVLLIGQRCILICSALVGLIITQTALLASMNQGDNMSIYNAMAGTLVGLINVIISCVMIYFYINKFKKA